MFDYCDERVTMISDGRRTARKEHRCAECGRMIQCGETYCYEYYKFDGRTEHHKTCSHCMVVRQWLSDECGGWVYGGVEEDIREHAQDGYGWPILRLTVAMKNNWARRDGSLRPVPKLPKTTHDIMREKGV
ncbi:hypothetical protein [Burkholderia ubonensis]|uniref:hypothetical protein n=1 Tax=Burkholderia ubonensis TaxID=101571 RepID=UPI0012F938D6|nr:hypothetical protein [Burkholderia ubonensis]